MRRVRVAADLGWERTGNNKLPPGLRRVSAYLAKSLVRKKNAGSLGEFGYQLLVGGELSEEPARGLKRTSSARFSMKDQSRFEAALVCVSQAHAGLVRKLIADR